MIELGTDEVAAVTGGELVGFPTARVTGPVTLTAATARSSASRTGAETQVSPTVDSSRS